MKSAGTVKPKRPDSAPAASPPNPAAEKHRKTKRLGRWLQAARMPRQLRTMRIRPPLKRRTFPGSKALRHDCGTRIPRLTRA